MDILCPRKGKMHKYLQAELLEVDGEKLYVASDETVDRHGEVIAIEGWDLENYKKNPVVLWGHDASYPAIGNAEKIGYKTVNGKKSLVFQPVFHKKDDLSKLVADLVEEGWVKFTSVGFMPKKMKENVITQSELLEISFVNIPANPSAGRLAYDFALSKGYGEDTIKEVMPEVIAEAKIKELEEEIAAKDAKIKELEIASVEVKPQRLASTGRQSKAVIKRNLAIKALNKAVEQLNKELK